MITWKRLCFSFKGRINRTIYWGYATVYLILLLFMGAIAINITDAYDAYSILLLPPFFLITYTDIAVTVKRLHDTNRSGWLCLWLLPASILGVIFSYQPSLRVILLPFVIYFFVVCGCLKGTEGKNNYGHPVDKLDKVLH